MRGDHPRIDRTNVAVVVVAAAASDFIVHPLDS
jgi:hypothetical protein